MNLTKKAKTQIFDIDLLKNFMSEIWIGGTKDCCSSSTFESTPAVCFYSIDCLGNRCLAFSRHYSLSLHTGKEKKEFTLLDAILSLLDREVLSLYCYLNTKNFSEVAHCFLGKSLEFAKKKNRSYVVFRTKGKKNKEVKKIFSPFVDLRRILVVESQDFYSLVVKRNLLTKKQTLIHETTKKRRNETLSEAVERNKRNLSLCEDPVCPLPGTLENKFCVQMFYLSSL